MPKWLSSLMIFIGFIALIVLALLPRNVEVTVTTNVKETIYNDPVHHYHAPTSVGATVEAQNPPDEEEDEE